MSGFQIPLDFSKGNFYENNCRFKDETNDNDTIKSINDFITLLVNSPNGSFKPDPCFGFSLKNLHFENADAKSEIREKKIRGKSDNFTTYAKDLKEAIKQFELRLQNPKVEINFEKENSKGTIEIVDTERRYEQNIEFYIWKKQ
jgi:hypothetical protein